MKVSITGANGFVGSHVVDEYLKDSRYDVHCIIRGSSDTKWLAGKNVTIHRCDYNDIASLGKATNSSDYIIHVAGSVAARSYSEFKKANVEATINLAHAALKNSPELKRFLLVSSQTASGPAKNLDSPTRPEDESIPLSSYGKSKREAELELLRGYSDKLPITIIRPPAVFGPRDTAILTVFQSISKGLGTVIGSKPKFVTLVYAPELARGIKLAAESDKAKGNTYFLGTEKPYPWKELNKMLGDAYGRKVVNLILPHIAVLSIGRIMTVLGGFLKKPPVFDHEKAVDFVQDYWICDSSSAQRDFGFQHKTTLQEAFRLTFEWYKSEGWIK